MTMSKRGMRLTFYVCAAIGVLAFGSDVSAQTAGPQSNSLTFSAPVQVPGVTLPAGTYVFEHVRTVSGDPSVQILSTSRKALIARVRTSPVVRKVAGANVTFRGPANGPTPAI